MGEMFSCCKSKKKKIIKDPLKEEKELIFEYSRNGQKKNKDQVGQDVSDIITAEIGSNVKYFTIYDGHGVTGKKVRYYYKKAALLAKDELRRILFDERKDIIKLSNREQVEKFFKKAFKSIQKVFKKQKHGEFDLSGSCCIACLIIDVHCYTINLGDSRAVLGTKGSSKVEKNLKIAYQLSIDQKANNEQERKRVEENGGQVTCEKNGPYRIFSKTEDGPGLAVSRTFGDLIGHNCGVSSEPTFTYKLLDSDDKFIVIASDGVWDVMNSTEVVGFIFEKLDMMSKEKLPEALVNEARSRWEVINMYKQKIIAEKQKDGNRNSTTIQTIDDITCIIYFINIPNVEKELDKEEDKLKNDNTLN